MLFSFSNYMQSECVWFNLPERKFSKLLHIIIKHNETDLFAKKSAHATPNPAAMHCTHQMDEELKSKSTAWRNWCKHFTKKLLLVTVELVAQFSSLYSVVCSVLFSFCGELCSWCVSIAHYFIFSRSLIWFSSLNAYNLSSPLVNGEYVFSVSFFSRFAFRSLRLCFPSSSSSWSKRAGFHCCCFSICFRALFVFSSFDNQIFASFEPNCSLFFVWNLPTSDWSERKKREWESDRASLGSTRKNQAQTSSA